MVERPVALTYVIGAVGGAVAVAIMQLLSSRHGIPLFVIPFASSITMVMGTPDTAPAQPRQLIGGHLVCTLVGLVVLRVVGPAPWAAAVAVGLSILAMHLTRTYHPPAGVDPVIVVTNDMSWSYLVAPIGAGVLLLAGFAYCWHNLFRRQAWPLRWF
jgi:CBS-domain-containing membrane protein